jgi:hypothetical protein
MAGLWRLDVHYMTMGVAYQQQSSERPRKWAKKFSFGVSSLQHGGSMVRDIIAGIVLITIIIVIAAVMYEVLGFIFK